MQLQKCKITRVLQIRLFRDFLLYRPANNDQISKDRGAFTFTVPQLFEISLPAYQLAQRHIPEDLHLQQSRNTRSHCVLQNLLLNFNPLEPELNPICYFLALLGAHYFLHVSRIRVKSLTLRLLMPYIYIWSTNF